MHKYTVTNFIFDLKLVENVLIRFKFMKQKGDPYIYEKLSEPRKSSHAFPDDHRVRHLPELPLADLFPSHLNKEKQHKKQESVLSRRTDPASKENVKNENFENSRISHSGRLLHRPWRNAFPGHGR